MGQRPRLSRNAFGRGPVSVLRDGRGSDRSAGRTRGAAGLLGNTGDIRRSLLDCRAGVLPEHWGVRCHCLMPNLTPKMPLGCQPRYQTILRPA
jgi:hypothetical protein